MGNIERDHIAWFETLDNSISLNPDSFVAAARAVARTEEQQDLARFEESRRAAA